MPRRERGERRRAPSRDRRAAILVVCGAESTEVAYLNGLRDHLGSASIDLEVIERAKAPDQVVARARDYRRITDFDERWCVLDVDRFEREGRKISQAVELARRGGVLLAISNPCFEFWLLLHHAYRTPPAIVCRDIEAVLRQYVPDYDKTQLKFSAFVSGISEAVDRGKKIDPSGMEHGINPSTGVWRLVEKLMEQKK